MSKVDDILAAGAAGKPAVEDDFDLGHLDLDAAAENVERMRDGGGEVLEATNSCDGGGCII